MQIFIINLENQPDKKSLMQKRLSAAGLDGAFLPAIFGKEISTKQKQEFSKNPNLTDGEIGVALSHRELFKKAIDSKDSYILVLEDDVLISQKTKSFIEAFQKNPINSDILFLGHHSDFSNEIDPACKAFQTIKLDSNFNLKRPIEMVIGAYGYILSKQGAQKLLQATETIDRPIDNYTGNQELLNILICTPPLVFADPGMTESSVINLERKQQNLGANPLKFRLKEWFKTTALHKPSKAILNVFRRINRFFRLFPKQFIN